MSDPFEFTDEPIDTGIVTATVTEPVELSAEAIQAAKALVNLPELTTVELAQLAREIAQDIGLMPSILQKHRLTQPQYEYLEKHNAFFRNMLVNEIKNWQSIKSTEQRLRLQAQAALEQQMPVVAQRMGNAAEKLGDVVEAFKAVARVAGVDSAPSGPVSSGERYQITIDLGADTNVVIAAQGRAPASAGQDATGALPNNAKGSGAGAALHNVGKGQGEQLALPALPKG